MENYKMDRNLVSAATFAAADDHATYYKDKTPLVRLNAACFIINQIFEVTPNLAMDKTITQSRSHAKSI